MKKFRYTKGMYVVLDQRRSDGVVRPLTKRTKGPVMGTVLRVKRGKVDVIIAHHGAGNMLVSTYRTACR